MITLDGLVGYAPGQEWDTYTTRYNRLGTLMWDPWTDRMWRFCRSSAASIISGLSTATGVVAGQLQQAPGNTANHLNNSVQAATAVGSLSLPVTLGSTSALANEYQGGYASVREVSTAAQMLMIDEQQPQAAVNSGGVMTILLRPGSAVQVALTTSNHVDLIHNPYNCVITNPTTATEMPVGVAQGAIASGSYGWIQTHGVASVESDSNNSLVLGNPAVPSTAVAGCVMASAASTSPAIGTVQMVGAASKQAIVYLTID